MNGRKGRILLLVPRGVSPKRVPFRVHPPDGLAFLASELLANGFEVELLDAAAEGWKNYRELKDRNVRLTGLSNEKIISRIEGERFDLIGVHYGLCSNQFVVNELVSELKDNFGTPIVLGGASASSLRYEILGRTNYEIEKIPGADFVIRDRGICAGEGPLIELFKNIVAENKNYSKIEGLVFPGKGGLPIVSHEEAKFRRDILYEECKNNVVDTGPAEIDLTNLKLPARHLYKKVNGRDIYSFINNPHSGYVDFTPYATIVTSRNCNFNCSFCATPSGWMRRPLANIYKELDSLKAGGIKTIQIEDDNFGGHTKQHLLEACKIIDRIRELGLMEVCFPNGLTLKSLQDFDFLFLNKLMELVNRGTKVRISLPLESGSDNTLRKLIRKPHTRNMIDKLLNEIRRRRYDSNSLLELEAFFVIGVVDEFGNKEPMESIEKTFKYAEYVAKNFDIETNLWICKVNPPRPQYKIWRRKNPSAGFEKLMFNSGSGIWGSKEEEEQLLEKVIDFNKYLRRVGHASKRPIFVG